MARLITVGSPNLGIDTTPFVGNIKKNDNILTAFRGMVLGAVIKNVIMPFQICANCAPNDYLH